MPRHPCLHARRRATPPPAPVRVVGAFLLAVVATTVLATRAPPAAAAGNPAVDAHVVIDPVLGWVPGPADAVAGLVDTVQRAESAVVGGDLTPATAARQWQAPGARRRQVGIVLVAFRATPRGAALVDADVAAGATAAAASFCAGAIGAPPATDTGVASVPGSHVVTCTDGGRSLVAAVTFAVGNVLAVVESTGLSVVALEQVALLQFAQLPRAGLDAPGDGPWTTAIAAAAGVVVVISAGAALSGARRRRRGTPGSEHVADPGDDHGGDHGGGHRPGDHRHRPAPVVSTTTG